jgi:hypothetical protein
MLVIFIRLCCPAAAVAAGEARRVSRVVNVADTRNIPAGLTRWVADVYNTSYWQFGVLVLFLMTVMGLVLGYGCDRLLSSLGIGLGRMHHHE